MWYDNLKEKKLWENFEAISRIPRESGNEEGIRKYLLSWAKEKGLKALSDKAGNVVIYSPATEGKENVPSLCLQGHMDMVCVKRDGSNHDFKKDPIEIVYEDGSIHAKDTSLGADNGIAIASIMTLFEDKELAHGPLEALFTVSEETGLNGAFGLDSSNIHSRLLLNLDSEEEGVIYTGCAGGIEIDTEKKAKLKSVPSSWISFTLSVSGLLGGHSGAEIHRERANAIKLIARALHRLPEFMLVDINGGSRRNVIPSSASVTFVTDKKNKETVESVISQLEKDVKNEYKIQDPNIRFTLIEGKAPEKAIKAKTSSSFIEALYLAPHGVQAMSMAIPGVVETSNNLAIVKMEEGKLKAISSTRSLIESAKHETAYRVGAAFEDMGIKVVYNGDYPSWQPNPSSAFTKEVTAMYKSFTKKKPVVTCIHAGLECGIINSIVDGMDSLSIGPNLFDVHSVNEHIDAASAERMMEFLHYLVSNLK